MPDNEEEFDIPFGDDAHEVDEVVPASQEVLDEIARAKVENHLPEREFDASAEPVVADEYPTSVITEEDEQAILAANERASVVDVDNSAVHNIDEDQHNDDPTALFGPPQKGESEPADLDAVIKEEEKARRQAIEESAIGTGKKQKPVSND